MFGRSVLLPPEYNLARAQQERVKAQLCDCPASRRSHLELAQIFESRASEYRALAFEALLIEDRPAKIGG